MLKEKYIKRLSHSYVDKNAEMPLEYAKFVEEKNKSR